MNPTNIEPVTEAELARVAELDAKATPGPWKRELAFKARIVAIQGPIGPDIARCEQQLDPRTDCDNAALIAEYRTLTPRLARELAAARAAIKVAREALEKQPCKCRRSLIFPVACPTCAGKLEVVSNPGHFNSEQWDSMKAGDYFCRSCKGDEGRSGHKYWDRDELPWNVETCDRCAALAQLNTHTHE